jgi:hypothetical protein
MTGFEYLDPTEQRIVNLDQRIASFEDYQVNSKLSEKFKDCNQKYQDFNIQEVVTCRFAYMGQRIWKALTSRLRLTK